MPSTVSIPKWLIVVILAFAGALTTVGTIAITNAATINGNEKVQVTQFEDIKARLVRIEAKLDSLGE